MTEEINYERFIQCYLMYDMLYKERLKKDLIHFEKMLNVYINIPEINIFFDKENEKS